MQESKARELMNKYRDGRLSEEERVLLESWYLKLARSKDVRAEKEVIETYLDQISPPVISRTRSFKPLYRWISAAASVLIVLGSIGLWLYSSETGIPPAEHIEQADALPGDNRALLTLANGESIFLDRVSNGKLAQEGNMSIVKTQEGEIVYSFIDTNSDYTGSVTFNKIETPKAGQYRVVLPDGTQAWLNAASSIRFPSAFAINERVVEITGEVYFEVAKMTAGTKPVPFRVRSGNQDIEVLGTIFNVNSYSDEDAIKTTLLEGSIQIKRRNIRGKDVILKPGQQAQFKATSDNPSSASDIQVREVDTSTATAWKDGFFRFDGVGLPELMRQLSRWYNMEVIYEGPVRDYEFVGRIERSTRLSKVLRILEIGGVRFHIEKNKIIVTE